MFSTSFKPNFKPYTVSQEAFNFDDHCNNDENSQALVKQVKKNTYLEGTKQALVCRVNDKVTLTILNLTPWELALECYTLCGRVELKVDNKLVSYFSPDSCHILFYNKEDENHNRKLVFIEKDDAKSRIAKHSLTELPDRNDWYQESRPKILVD